MDIKIAVAALAVAFSIGVAGCSREQSDWEKARGSNNADSYELFVKKYPSGSFTAQAQARLKELNEERDWQKARDADTAEAYQAFLKQYPEGKWSEEARIRVENFSLAQAPSTPPATEATPGPAAPKAKPAAPPAPAAPAARAGAHAPAAKPSAPAASGGSVIQLGAYKTGTAAANRHWARLEKQFPAALKGLTPTVKSSGRGAHALVRLQVTGLGPTAARQICKTLKAKAAACVVLPKVRHQ